MLLCFMNYIFNFWYEIISKTSAVFLGAISGGILGAIIGPIAAYLSWKITTQSKVAYDLLKEALEIQSLTEAWIYTKKGFNRIKLSNLDLTKVDYKEFFEKVEVRTILDSKWNFPKYNFFKIIEFRRTWIIRNEILLENSNASNIISYPAILSSKAIEELSGWLEKVYIAKSGNILSNSGLISLKPLLSAIIKNEVLEEFKLNKRISDEAYNFFKQDYFNKIY